jgi:hypothetical protein
MADVRTCQYSEMAKVKTPYGIQRQRTLVCGLSCQDGSDLCPRHTFLATVNQHAQGHREHAQAQAKAAGVSGIQPNTRAGMIAKGYVFTGNSSCRNCGRPIEWWKKTPNGRQAPFDPMPDAASFAKSHFASCPAAASFRRAS